VDTTSVIRGIEAALADQLSLAGGDPAVVAAGEAVIAALTPSLSKGALELAEQAALEVRAQLPDHQIDVVLREGEPTLVVRPVEHQVSFTTDDLEARLTLRLPTNLKRELEAAAGSAGDSINAYVIKSLSGRSRSNRRVGKQITGTFRT
jgi:hypothetical protein